jgi:hypothetical protein
MIEKKRLAFEIVIGIVVVIGIHLLWNSWGRHV